MNNSDKIIGSYGVCNLVGHRDNEKDENENSRNWSGGVCKGGRTSGGTEWIRRVRGKGGWLC